MIASFNFMNKSQTSAFQHALLPGKVSNQTRFMSSFMSRTSGLVCFTRINDEMGWHQCHFALHQDKMMVNDG